MKKKRAFKDLDVKKGRLSKHEIEVIKKYAPTKDDEWIAAHLNRHPDTIQKFRVKELALSATPEEEAALSINYDLKNKPFWKDFKQQFTEKELELLVYHWTQIISQFKQDITPTEELQLLDLIQIKLLVNRNLKDRNELYQQIQQLNKMINELYDKWSGQELPDEEKKYLASLTQELANLQASETSKTKEHIQYLSTEERLYKDLKTTRNQRIDRLEDSKTNILDWLKAIQEMDERDKEGKELLLLREATYREKERLGEYHEYMDGIVDQPLFNSETVK